MVLPLVSIRVLIQCLLDNYFILVASHREEKGLPVLQTYTIDVISSNSSKLEHDDEMLKQTKMSSTFIREWIVKSRKK